MTVTKADITNTISNQSGFSRGKSTQLVETTLEIIKGSLESGEDIMISGFGKFSVKGKAVRSERNPAAGNDIMLGAGGEVTFKCSRVLVGKLNGKQPVELSQRPAAKTVQ